MAARKKPAAPAPAPAPTSTPRRAENKRRHGTAFWLADEDGTLLRNLAIAEDRTLQTIIRRALTSYAEHSEEYGRWQAKQLPE